MTPTVNGTQGQNGWYTSNVSVLWNVTDTESAITTPECTTTVVTEDTTGTTVSCTATSAGGTTTKSVTVKRDATAPVISGADSANTTWRNTDLSSPEFTVSDATSGLTTSSPAKFTLTASAQSASATSPTVVTQTVTDQAGNTATRSLSALIDKTAPVVSADVVNTAWRNTDLVGSFTASDGLSGLAKASDATFTVTVSAESASKTAPSVVKYTVTDAAGNSTTRQVSALIDKTAPTISGQDVNNTAWRNGDLSQTFSAQDALSGLGTTSPATFTLTASAESANGPTTVSQTITDAAGNSATRTVSALIDRTAPTASITPSGTMGQNNWYVSNVAFKASGEDALSGGVTCTTLPDLTSDTNGITVSATCTDAAGNSGKGDLSVKRDATAPVISGSNVNDTTWRNSGRSEAFTASDSGSGLADGRDGSFTLTASAESGSASAPTLVSRTVTDRAGNSAVRTLSALIDTTAPTISGNDIVDEVWRNTSLSQGYTASDALSGLTTSSPVAFTLTASEESGSATSPTVVRQIVTDQAGNSATRTLSARIDMTAPVVSANVADTTWRNTDFKGSFTASDALSGLEKASDASFDLTVSAESADRTTPSVVTYTVRDAAGNSTTRQASALIDRTAPATTLTPGGTLGLAGWYVSDVTFKAEGTDALSGGVTCTQPGALTSDTNGTDVSASCTDAAGNSKVAELTVKRDTTAPTVSGSDVVNTTWRNKDLSADFTSSDKGSGLAADGDAAFTLTASAESKSATAPTLVDRVVKDQAGNATTRTLSALIDETKPTLSYTRSAANDAGWNNSDVTVSFTCSDDLSGSASCTAPVTLSGEGAGQSVPGTATDRAGNSAAVTVGAINIDKTKPTVVGTAATAPNGANGWYTSNILVNFSCSDGLSTCTSASGTDTVMEEGGNQSARWTVTDKAGNSTTGTLNGLKLDKTKPTLLSMPIAQTVFATSASGAVVNYTAATARDNLDSNPTVSCAPASGSTFALGVTKVTCTATDQAGLASSGDVNMTVSFNFKGFFQPVDMGTTLNRAKAGSAIPIKFTLGGVKTLDVLDGAPTVSAFTCGTGATIDDIEQTVTASVSGLQWDSTAQQYVYVWKTSTSYAGQCVKLNVKFRDGTTQSALFNFTR